MRRFLLLLAIAPVTACAGANDPGDGPYFPKVKTIIADRCLGCHSAVTGTWSGRPTQLDTDDQIVSESLSIKGAVADPVSPVNKRMPQDGPLTSGQVAMIVRWASL